MHLSWFFFTLQVRPPGVPMAPGISMAASASMSHSATVPAKLGEDNSGVEGENNMGVEEVIQDRGQTRSPVNFREGRRASDGLVAQGIIAFRQRLRECMRARGMVELRQEHHQLQTLYASCSNNSATTATATTTTSATTTNNSQSPPRPSEDMSPPPSSSTPSPHPHPHPHRKLSAPHHSVRQWSLDDPAAGGGAVPPTGGGTMGRRRPLMKRMSLPSESFDIQPHRLLALKQSLFLEQQLDRAGNTVSGSQEEDAPLPPPPPASTQALPTQVPPLPGPQAASHYDYGVCGKSLQQQLLSHRLQQKRQVFQKHSLPHPHPHLPHPHPLHCHAHNNNQLPLPQQLSSQMQQLQIDPNNLPRIDFGPHYAVQPQNPSSCASHTFSSGMSTSGVAPATSYAPAGLPAPAGSGEGFPGGFPFSSPSVSAATKTSVADAFLEQIGMGGGEHSAAEDSGNELNLNDSFGEEGEQKEGMEAAAVQGQEAEEKEPPTTPTHQWQRRTGVFMAVHPFQDSSAFSLPASHTATSVLPSGAGDASFPGLSQQSDCVGFPTDPDLRFSQDHRGMYRSQEEKGVLFAPSTVASSTSSPDDNLTNYLHTLRSGHDSFQGVKSGTGTVDLLGLASHHLESCHHSNVSFMFSGGDTLPSFQSPLGAGMTKSGSGDFTVSEQVDEHMDIS